MEDLNQIESLALRGKANNLTDAMNTVKIERLNQEITRLKGENSRLQKENREQQEDIERRRQVMDIAIQYIESKTQ